MIYIHNSGLFVLSFRYMITKMRKLKKSSKVVDVKTILEKSLHLHGSLSPSQIHSLLSNLRNLIPVSTAKSMTAGVNRHRMLNLYILDQLYTVTMKV